MARLPCFQCPHASTCCSYGVSLSDQEKAAIVARYGQGAVTWSKEEDGWRTSIFEGRCIFLRNNACSIHGESFYPQVCKNFHDNYEHDKTICPEIKDP